MKAVFSSLFKSDLLEEAGRYDAISLRLGQEFRGRVEEAARAVIHWNGGDHVGPMVILAEGVGHFRFSSIIRSKVIRFSF